MSHYNRRQPPTPIFPPSNKPDSLSLPFKNNEARLKLIYEGQQIFRQRPKEPSFKKQNNRPPPTIPLRKNADSQIDNKHRPNIHNLQLREVKVSNRYREQEREQRDQRAESFQMPHGGQTERIRPKLSKEGALTTRNRDDGLGTSERQELFKIKRKSISGSLKKKLKEAQAHHLSSVNPTIPIQLNYFQEGKRVYKEGKISEALKLFQLAIQKNPDLAQGYYHCALCHLSKRNYQKSYDLLVLLTQRFPSFDKKTVYLFTAIAAKHLDMTGKAVTALTSGISKYPDYLDLYVYRAKLSEAQGQLEDAQEDYEVVLKVRKDSPQVLLGYALLLKRMGLTSNALSTLASALYSDKCGDIKSKILLQRLKINYQIGKLDECKKDLSKMVSSEQSEVEYYRGLLHLSQKNKKQALLSFQKCIRSNDHPQSVAGSLVQITKSKIQDRDFYSALYHINRSSFLKVDTPQIQKFKLFAQGVVFMMKRKINEGVDNFYKLQQKHSPIGSYFDRLFYLYRAFGHFMQNKHQLAIEDYKESEKYTPKDKNVKYNQLIAEGIVYINQGKFDLALATFDQAQNTISHGLATQKIEPFIYRAMTFIEKVKAAHAQPSKSDELQTLQEIFRALKELDKAYDVNDSNSNMLYLRALIYMYLGKCDDGLQDIIKAISKSQENVAKYFFYRALAHETLNNKKQALNDFNICINLDEKYTNAYLQRAKLLFSTEQAAKGLEDLRKVKEIDATVNVKLHEFCLYYLYNEYDLAELCLQQMQPSDNKHKLQVLLDLKQLRITNARDKMTSTSDQMICQIILGHYSVQEVPADDLQFFSRVEYYSYIGIKCFHSGDYEEAINNFTLALKEKSLIDLQESAGGTEEENQENQEEAETALESQTKKNQQHYINYNLFLSYLANQQRKKAYETFIRDILPAKEAFLRSQQVSHLSKILFQTIKAKEDQPQPLEKQVLEIVLFRSLFGQSVDYIQINLPNYILRTKLCYLMPYSRQIQREYSPKLSPDFILSCLKISEVQNRPQPPWVRRNNQDLVFTDEVIDINVEFQTTQHDEENQQEEEEEYQGEEEEEGTEREEEESKEEAVFDPRRFRDQMKLDDDIERKLQKIMDRKKKTQ